MTTHTATRLFCFEKAALSNLLERSGELNSAFAAMLNANLATKLVRSNAVATP